MPPRWRVKGYTRLDKIGSEIIRKELEISAIQDVRLKYKQNWINRLERTDNTRLPKHALNYKPRGRRDRGRPRKRWQTCPCRNGSRDLMHGGRWWWRWRWWCRSELSQYVYRILHVDYPATTFRTLMSLFTPKANMFRALPLRLRRTWMTSGLNFSSTICLTIIGSTQFALPQTGCPPMHLTKIASFYVKQSPLNVAMYISVKNPVYPRWCFSPSSRQIVSVAEQRR